MRRLASLFAVGIFLSGCTAIASPSPSAQATPDAAVVRNEAMEVASKFVAAWQYRNWSMLLELTDPGDVTHYTSAAIIGLLTGFETMAGVTWLNASAGPATPASRSPDASNQSPVPSMAVKVSLSFYTINFGRVAFRRTLTLTHGAGGWRVRWRPSILFPELGDDGTLSLTRTLGRRGGLLAEDGTVFAETRDDGVRVYPQEWLAGQTIGYVSPVTSEDLKTLAAAGYQAGDVVGRMGLESGAEALLRGTPGLALSAQRPGGDPVTVLQRPMVPGADVKITIRPALQAQAEALIAGYHEAGTAVLDPLSGDVWALASAPLFNPNAMVLGTTLDGRRLAPPSAAARLNHALLAAYPAGSSFKPFTFLAALKTKVASRATRMPCLGTWVFDGFTFHNYADHSLGNSVSLTQAMAFSCNTTYRPLSIRVWDVSHTALTDLIAAFGFGQITGINHLAETAGVLPDAGYFERTPRWDGAIHPYGPFDQIQLAIGQGSYLGTPLQLANAYNAFATSGTLWVPRLVTQANLPNGRLMEQTAPRVMRHIDLPAADYAYLLETLRAVTSLYYGTAYYAFAGFGIPVAGKSGTAETGTPQPDAWFPAFAPANDPKITVATVLVRVPLATGGSDSAPLVRRLMAYYFSHP
jgi:cell division protein FtsI/penicillin-binding protein 2